MRFIVVPILAPALLKGSGLMFLRETGDQIGMAGGNAFLNKCLCDFGDELQERQTSINVRCALARLQHERGHIVTGHVEQALEALRLFVWMDIDALRVFDQLPFLGGHIIQFNDASGNGEEFRKLRGTETTRTRNDLKAICLRTNSNWL